MKKILLPILLVCAMAIPAHGQTILVIDVNGVFNGLTEVQTEIAKMRSAVDEYNNYLKEQAQVLIQLQQDVQTLKTEADNPSLTQDARDTFKNQWSEKSAQLDQKRSDVQNFQQTSNNEIQQAQENLVKTQLEKIRAEVATIAAKRGAVLVVNKANMGMLSAVMYNDAKLDISDEVMADLNKAAAASATPMPSLPSVPATAAPASAAKPAGTTK